MLISLETKYSKIDSFACYCNENAIVANTSKLTGKGILLNRIDMIEKIVYDEDILGIIIRNNFRNDGIEFFTDEQFSQQLGYMNRPKGHLIQPHRHNLVPRKVVQTQEVLFIKSGEVRVDFYSDEQIYLESRVLEPGDIILLAAGGHGFRMLKPSEIIEVKQGPYCGEEDKVRFQPVAEEQIRLK